MLRRLANFHTVLRNIWIIFAPVAALLAQGPAQRPVSTASQLSLEVSETNARILFLNIEAAEVGRRKAGEQTATTASERAAVLHVSLPDLEVIDKIVTAFVEQQTVLKNGSIAYFNQQHASGLPLDPAIVHSFTVRREMLANEAFMRIRSEISTEGYEGFQRYFELEFRKSVHCRR
jgi:hypothetical protein